jgi:hypothetical protein
MAARPFRSTRRSARDIDEHEGQVAPAKRIVEGAGPCDHIRSGVEERRTDDALLKVDDGRSGFGIERREGHMDSEDDFRSGLVVCRR